jgi:hypothetical protein
MGSRPNLGPPPLLAIAAAAGRERGGHSFQGPMTHGGTAPSHYDLHVWTVKGNPRGLFAQYNPSVSC